MANESQVEELEVLESIFTGDDNFKIIQNDTIQYKYGEEGTKCTVLIEVKWPPEYPEVVPIISLGAFYNNHLSSTAKSVLLTAINVEAEKDLGTQQTYTIIDWVKENYETILTPHLTDEVESVRSDFERCLNTEEITHGSGGGGVGTGKIKKEQLTKSQKRREWDKVDNKGERPRGYDWVDVVKHLSQTGGSKQDAAGDSSSLQTAQQS